jgi:hypothetical protein
MTDHDIKILKAMKRYGGSFASNIAQAALAADSINYARLKAAFPDLWDSYERFIEIRNASGKVD